MLNNYKANIVLTFNKDDGTGGEPKKARVTLSNVRRNLTAEEIRQVGEAFGSLIKHELYEIEIVQFSLVGL